MFFNRVGGDGVSDLFYFASITNTETQTFDNSLEHFHSAGIIGTIRENLQNSIDAKLSGSDWPVKVTIGLTDIKKEQLPGMSQLEEHIASLIGGNKYTKDTISHMQEALNRHYINVLTFEDNNTKGLSGANKLGTDSTYNIFAYKKGVHYEESDAAIEITRGGSHGVGKIANNAASDLHLMYFANCDEFGQQHLGGTIQLIEHKLGSKSYRSTGYFTEMLAGDLYKPHENTGFHQIFEKKTRGLKVIIPFLREEYASEQAIIQGVCDNFFIAILQKKLEVEVLVHDKTIMINQETVKQLINQRDYYSENLANISEIKKNFTPLYINTYLEKPLQKIEVASNTDTYTFDLRFAYNEEIKDGRVGIVRSMGMKIVDHKIPGYVKKPYNAVLIGGPKEDAYLKSLENESHTALSADALRDRSTKRNATKFLRNLNKAISEIIQSEYDKLYPTDGKVDTSSLLYEQKVTFRSKLEELSEKVELTNGKKVRKKKTGERRDPDGNKPVNPSGKKTKPKQRKPRKLKVIEDDEIVHETIIAPTELVNRVVFTDREILQFNLKEIKEVIPNGKVNIGFRVVDGDGKEYDYEFDLKVAYSDVLDVEDGLSYDFDSFIIKNVQVLDSEIRLVLKKKNNRSSSLKFVYKLEVIA